MSDPTDLQWGPCLPMQEVICTPGELIEECWEGAITCELAGGVPFEDDSGCWEGGETESTPLVLRFDRQPVRYAPSSSVGFDIDGEGVCDSFDWPMPETPWLALDRDGNGAIDAGSELFGSGTILSGGERARNGFAALAELDSDGDGSISSADARWDELLLWGDHDGDRVGSGLELQRLSSEGLVRIDLDYAIDKLCDLRGNCEVEKARFVFSSATGELSEGEVVDVHLACQ
jgi:hypothetical protein